MNLSQVGINLIKSFEGCRLTSYQDVAGVWTIGYGHTSGVRSAQTITQQQADSLLAQDLQKFSDAVNANVRVLLNQYQFDALVSFTYNVGITAFKTSTLLEMLNNGDYSGASNQFSLWVHAKGKIIQGLVNRRIAEKALFDRVVETPTNQSFGVGSVVKLQPYASQYATGENIPDFVKQKSYKIIQSKEFVRSISKLAYLLDGINSWVLEQDIVGSGFTISSNVSKPSTQDYTIRTGENLTIIAKRTNTTVKDLMNLNPSIKNPNIVYAGQKIKVPFM